MNQPMTTQERAAELCFKLALLVDAGTHMEVDTDAMKAIADALTATRRAAMLEAVQEVDLVEADTTLMDFDVTIACRRIRKQLTKLAQEG